MPTYKTISIASAVEKNNVASGVPFLTTLVVTVVDPTTSAEVETLRFVKNTEDLTIGGYLYAMAEFSLDLKEESGAQPEITLTVVDFQRLLMPYLDQYGGAVGFKAVVGVVNAQALNSPPEVALFFEIIGASTNEYRVSFTLGAENPLMKLFPRRQQAKDYCGWRYKDQTTCRYTGALPSCDLTLNGANGCKAHDNAINFGGFPGINNSASRYA